MWLLIRNKKKHFLNILICIYQDIRRNPSSWVECSGQRPVIDPRTLVNLSGTERLLALSVGPIVRSFYICCVNWQWLGHLGLFIVCREFFLEIEKQISSKYFPNSAKSLQTPSNIFVINLAICDFMMMTKTPIFIYNSFNRGYALGHTGCQAFAFIGSLSGIGAAITNACIAYDRYNVIANPFEGKLTKIKAIFFVVLVWFYTIPWAVFPLLQIWGRFVPGKNIVEVKRFIYYY